MLHTPNAETNPAAAVTSTHVSWLHTHRSLKEAWHELMLSLKGKWITIP